MFIACFCLSIVSSAFALDGTINPKTKIKKGVLDNGLTYYLYKNPATPGQASFYLMQNVGAIYEDDDQDGLAHFLEHMCFEGTKNYPERTIMDMFEKEGLERHINAATGLEETVYFFKDIPVRKKAFTDHCLMILKDWCHDLSFDSTGITRERNVIVEELRTRRNVQTRLNEQIFPVSRHNSQYSKRFITGTPENIKNFKKESLTRFYKDWYRTDLQAIVVVGDIEIHEIEQKIKNVFSTIPAVSEAKPIPSLVIEDMDSIMYVNASDVEVKKGSIAIEVRIPNYKSKDKFSYYDKETKHVLLNLMMSRRCKALVKKDTTNLYTAAGQFSKVSKLYDGYTMGVEYKQGRSKEALKSMTSLHNDVLQNGFTQEELDFAIEQMKKYFKQMKKYGMYMPNQQLFEKIKDNFINGVDIDHPADEYKIFSTIISGLTIDNLKAYHNKVYNGQNKTIIVVTKPDDKECLSKQQIIEIEKKSVAIETLPDEEEEEKVKEALLDSNTLLGCKIKKKKSLGELNATKWILENGATVIYKEAPMDRDVVTIVAKSQGGISQLPKDLKVAGQTLSRFQAALGIKGMDANKLEEITKTDNLSLTIGVKNYEEYLVASSNFSGVENLFQAVYSSFQNMEIYEDEYKKASKIIKLDIHSKNYNALLADTLNELRYGQNSFVALNDGNIDQLTRDNLLKSINNRFSNANDFIFYVVGGIGKSKAKHLVEKYIGSINSTEEKENFNYVSSKFPKGRFTKSVQLEMVDQKGGQMYLIQSEMTNLLKDELCHQILCDYLQINMQKVMRELVGGTYGVQVMPYEEAYPKAAVGITMEYDCDPARVKELNAILNTAVGMVAERGMPYGEFTKIKKDYEGHRHAQQNTHHLLDLCINLVEKGEDRSVGHFHHEQIEAINHEYINDYLKRFFGKASVIDLSFIPQNL